MIRKPGRLHRTVPVSSLLTIDAGAVGTYGDDGIESVSIRRGSRTKLSGLTPSTATVTLAGSRPTSYDDHLDIDLTAEASQWVETQSGRPAADTRNRWFGRIGKQTVTDRGPRRSTRLECADWAAQAALTGVTAAVQLSDRSVDTLYHHAWSKAKLPGGWHHEGTTCRVASPKVGTQIKVADIWTKYGADAGVTFYTDRGGGFHGIGAGTLHARASGWSLAWPQPVARRQVLSPVEWEQPATSPGQVVYKQRSHDDENTIETVTMSVWGGGPLQRPIRAADVDTTNLWDPNDDEQSDLTIGMLARANRAAGLWYNVNSVTFDMLRLLTSDNIDDRKLAGQLLAMQIFEPLALTKDWPAEAAGVTFATEITETITPDAWTLQLGLQRVEYVTGQHTSDIRVPGVTWDDAYPAFVQWDMTTNTWDGSPTYQLGQ